MSEIERLLAELCPDGVEVRPLSQVMTYVRGVTYRKSDEQADGPIHVLRANNIRRESRSLDLTDVKRVGTQVSVRDDQRLRKGDILVCAGSGSRQHIGKAAYIAEDMSQTFGGFMAVIRVQERSLYPRFLFHLLNARCFA